MTIPPHEPSTPYNTPPPQFPPTPPGTGSANNSGVPQPVSEIRHQDVIESETPPVSLPRPSTGATPGSEELPEQAPGNGRRGHASTVAVALSLILAVLAVASTAVMWTQMRNMEGEITRLSAANDGVDSQQQELSATVSALSGDLDALQNASGVPLSTYLENLNSRASQAQRDARDAQIRSDLVASRTDELVSCVNEYMRIVADSGGGYYRFYFCK